MSDLFEILLHSISKETENAIKRYIEIEKAAKRLGETGISKNDIERAKALNDYIKSRKLMLVELNKCLTR